MTASGEAIGTVAKIGVDRPVGRARRIEEEADPGGRRTVTPVEDPGRVAIAAGVMVEKIERQKEAGQKLKRTKKIRARRRAGTEVARRWPRTRR